MYFIPFLIRHGDKKSDIFNIDNVAFNVQKPRLKQCESKIFTLKSTNN